MNDWGELEEAEGCCHVWGEQGGRVVLRNARSKSSETKDALGDGDDGMRQARDKWNNEGWKQRRLFKDKDKTAACKACVRTAAFNRSTTPRFPACRQHCFP